MMNGIQRATETVPSSAGEGQKRRLKEACKDFEALMMNNMLKGMRESVIRAEKPEQATEIYEGMFDEQISKEMAKTQKNGLADMLYQQLSKLVREAPAKPGAVDVKV